MAKGGGNKRTGKGKAAGAAAEGIMKPLKNVLKDGKKVDPPPGGTPSTPNPPGGGQPRLPRPPRPPRTPEEQARLAGERFDNFHRRVAPGDLRNAPPPYPGGRPGHALDEHGVRPPQQAEVLNNPERVFSGTYRAPTHTREVDVYYRNGSVVITEAGKKDSVITAYGRIDTNQRRPKAVDPEKWAGNEDYVEVDTTARPANRVVYPNRERWEAQDWP